MKGLDHEPSKVEVLLVNISFTRVSFLFHCDRFMVGERGSTSEFEATFDEMTKFASTMPLL